MRLSRYITGLCVRIILFTFTLYPQISKSIFLGGVGLNGKGRLGHARQADVTLKHSCGELRPHPPQGRGGLLSCTCPRVGVAAAGARFCSLPEGKHRVGQKQRHSCVYGEQCSTKRHYKNRLLPALATAHLLSHRPPPSPRCVPRGTPSQQHCHLLRASAGRVLSWDLTPSSH